MKTAVLIPDELFESAEGFARRLGMTRSELYAKALRDYLREHKGEGIMESASTGSTAWKRAKPAVLTWPWRGFRSDP